jgi:hypothetical protein
MLRKRNLIALLMAAMMSLGTIGVALADDGGCRTDEAGMPGSVSFVEREAAH